MATGGRPCIFELVMFVKRVQHETYRLGEYGVLLCDERPSSDLGCDFYRVAIAQDHRIGRSHAVHASQAPPPRRYRADHKSSSPQISRSELKTAFQAILPPSDKSRCHSRVRVMNPYFFALIVRPCSPTDRTDRDPPCYTTYRAAKYAKSR